MSAPSVARWVWCDADGRGRNVFAVFRRTLRLAASPRSATLHVFADSRYRLRVNGKVVGAGPARFVPSAPEFDSTDLRPWLREGENTIVVEVNHYGACAYQAMPDDRGGFIAWGSVEEPSGANHDLATPGDWRVWRSEAWFANAPLFSFAQPAVECLDTRLWDGSIASADAVWQPPVACADPEHWGVPAPRSIPPPLFDEHEVRTVSLATALAPEQRHAACVCVPGFDRHGKTPKLRFAVATWLFSACEQDVVLGLFWGPFHLNGRNLVGAADPRRGNRVNYAAPLRAGWNLLYGEPELLEDVWGVLLALPAGVTAHIAPQPNAAQGLRCTDVRPEPQLRDACPAAPATLDELQALPLPWRDVTSDARDSLPARDCAWDLPAADGRLATTVLPLQVSTARPFAAVLDFGGEYLGHVVIDVTAPAGTLMDVAVDERQRADGLLALFATNPFTDTADRFILRGGAQRIEGFHVRGGRYIQVVLRPPAGATGTVVLTRVAVRRVRSALVDTGTFACSDALFNWVWCTGVATLHACTEDAYLDCPWRERGLYGGDVHVIGQVQRLVSRDDRLVRRCLHLFAQAQREDGLLPNVAPAWNRHELADFVLLWILSLHAHWQWTGDAGTVRALWPTIERIWRSTSWTTGRDGLWNTGGLRLFIDWGVPKEHREGDAHALLNVLRVAALRASAELASAAGQGDATAQTYALEAETVSVALQQRLWLAEVGAFGVRLRDGLPEGGPSLHASILALAFGVEDPAQTAPLLEFVRAALRGNFAAGVTGDRPYGHVELYFLHFALRALYRFDLAADAEELVRSHYEPMRAAGAWTLWECFSRGLKGVGSLCHAWSGGPLVAFVRDTVGIQPQAAGADVEVLVAPCAEAVDSAEAVVPHPHGDLRVAWRAADGELRLRVSMPAGLRWRVAPRGRLGRLRLRLEEFPSSTVG